MNISIINPIDYPDWDKLLLSNQEYSFFHSSHWAKVLCESYGYKPLYFVDILTSNLKRSAPQMSNNTNASNLQHSSPQTSNDNNASHKKLQTCLPLMEVKSFLTGQRGVSLPFTDYCDPIVTRDIHFQELFNYLIEYGKQAGWKFIEIRSNGDSLHKTAHSSYYYGHTLDLLQNKHSCQSRNIGNTKEHENLIPSNPPLVKGGRGDFCFKDQIFSNFRSSTKRNIKKAIREGVEVNISNSLESIKEFYRLNCITRKHHGLPPQPYYFFEKIFDHIVSKNYGFVVLASYKGMTIAGAVYFHLGKKAVYKYGASDRRYLRLRPNNLVMWEAIKWYSQNGYENFSFGRTEPENKGLMQFKAGWGAEERIIKYYRYDIKKSAFVNGNSHMSEIHSNVFNKMPIPLLKVAGSLFYRHMG